MPKDSGKRRDRPEEDLALLDQITLANPAAGTQFLEYLILQRRSTVRRLSCQCLVLLTSELLFGSQEIFICD